MSHQPNVTSNLSSRPALKAAHGDQRDHNYKPDIPQRPLCAALLFESIRPEQLNMLRRKRLNGPFLILHRLGLSLKLLLHRQQTTGANKSQRPTTGHCMIAEAFPGSCESERCARWSEVSIGTNCRVSTSPSRLSTCTKSPPRPRGFNKRNHWKAAPAMEPQKWLPNMPKSCSATGRQPIKSLAPRNYGRTLTKTTCSRTQYQINHPRYQPRPPSRVL